MAIRYALYENNLTDDPNDFTAVIQSAGTAETEQLVQDIIDFGTTLNEPEIREVILQYGRAMIKRLQNNERVYIEGIGEIYPTITGVFNGGNDTFDAARHSLNIKANVARKTEKAVVEAGVEKVEAIKPAPSLINVTDLTTGNNQGAITPGGMIEIVGHRLKYDKTAADEGVFFIASDGSATKVDNNFVGVNRPSKLLILVPAGLVSGDYSIEVRARVAGNADTRSGQYTHTVTIP